MKHTILDIIIWTASALFVTGMFLLSLSTYVGAPQ
jgi:hypothetical protein